MNGVPISRRSFLASTLSGSTVLVVGAFVPALAIAGDEAATTVFKPNAFVQLDGSGAVTLFVGQAEMGQGVLTSLPMIVADELDVDLDKVIIQRIDVDAAFNHPFFGAQVTGGSTSVRGFFRPLRQAGAEARHQLMEAAALRWEVDRTTLSTEPGFVVHEPTGRRLAYGDLVGAASQLDKPDPESIKLKPREQYRYIGKSRRRTEGRGKVTGQARFGIDVVLPGMLVAVVARPPVFGATAESFDVGPAMRVPGVRKVKAVPEGIAVIATNFHAARKGRDALTVKWVPESSSLSSEDQGKQYAKLAESSGAVAVARGEIDESTLEGDDVLSLDIDVPYLAHATMEPLNATVHHKDDTAEVWTGTQMPGADQARAAAILGLAPDKVQLHNHVLGGGFGRRANPLSDFVAIATNVAKDEGVPIKTIWTREDDTRGGWYRPRAHHRLRVRLGDDGKPKQWLQRVVAQSIMQGTPFESMGIKDGVDFSVVEGAIDMPYPSEHFRVECVLAPREMPVLWWRSVGHTHTAYALEHFIDLAARRVKQDPVAYRRMLLSEHPRWLAVLDKVTKLANWGEALPEGRARGVAIHKSFESIVGEVAEVSIEDGRPKVHRVFAAADLGQVINPAHAAAQIESGIVFGLSAALHQQITLEQGRVQQSNFHDYPLLRQNEMPQVTVEFIDSAEPPTGAGEPGTPPIAPAVANALLALTGKPVTSLPIRLGA